MRRYVLIALLTLLTLFCLPQFSCGGEDISEPDIRDSLKISTWLLSESLEGNGRFTYSPDPPDYGIWLTDDGKEIAADEAFTLDRLELNKPRVLAPMGFQFREHINIRFDCDGIVEIEVSDEGDENVRLRHSLDSPEEPWLGEKIDENAFRATAPVTVIVNPIGEYLSPAIEVGHRDTLTDREYVINVRTYDGNGTQIISAKLKLTVIPDEGYPWNEIYSPPYSQNQERSRFLSIELIEYDYSDVYKLDEYYGKEVS